MAKLKTFENNEQIHFYLAFHPYSDVNLNVNVRHIEGMMKTAFGDAQNRIFLSTEDNELVFRVQKPILQSENEMSELFKNLENIFIEGSLFRPHFTQFREDDIT